MSIRTKDAYGHQDPSGVGPLGTALVAAASGTAAGTVVPGGTIVTATPGSVNGNDEAGNFTVAIASGQGTTAGAAASVYFAQPYGITPKYVGVTVYDATSSPAAVPASVKPVAAGLNHGFTVEIGATATAADVLTIYYHVI